jgi:hypothetical protein
VICQSVSFTSWQYKPGLSWCSLVSTSDALSESTWLGPLLPLFHSSLMFSLVFSFPLLSPSPCFLLFPSSFCSLLFSPSSCFVLFSASPCFFLFSPHSCFLVTDRTAFPCHQIHPAQFAPVRLSVSVCPCAIILARLAAEQRGQRRRRWDLGEARRQGAAGLLPQTAPT